LDYLEENVGQMSQVLQYALEMNENVSPEEVAEQDKSLREKSELVLQIKHNNVFMFTRMFKLMGNFEIKFSS
jgi:hypothetical protein